jgi:pentose-5-phosphate-3-epimerase
VRTPQPERLGLLLHHSPKPRTESPKKTTTHPRHKIAGLSGTGVPKLNWIQADIIDGIFANNQTLQPQDWAPLIQKYANLNFEAHLMVKDPINWIQPCLNAGFTRITAHIEMMDNQQDFIKPIEQHFPSPGKERVRVRSNMDASPGVNGLTPKPTPTRHSEPDEVGSKNPPRNQHNLPEVGLALDLPTPISKLDSQVLPHLDVILLMSVPAGFGGQKFDPSVLEKIKSLNQLRQQKGYHFQIAVDGGLNSTNIDKIQKASTDLACLGSSLLQGNIQDNLKQLDKFTKPN